MVNVPVFEAPGQRPAASIIRDRSLLLVWPKAPAVKVLPGLPLEDVKLAPEKTSDWSATASRASTTRVRKAFFTFVPEAPLWLTRRSFQSRNRPGGWAGRGPVSYTHLRAHETRHDLVCRLLLEKKKKK